MGKQTVLITGGCGNMGWYTFQELYKRKDKFRIVLFDLFSKNNVQKALKYIGDPAVRFIWGDLTKYDDVLEAVTGADYVLHLGGMVSPKADYFPKACLYTNTKAAENIIRAIKAQPDPDAIKTCYIGTVAQTGERDAPIHWGRTGDPIKISVYDHYALSKTVAERIFAESGLKYWVSLRQSGVLYPEIIKNYDPIIFHVPINGVFEWATVEDSGRLLANLCSTDLPDHFWRSFYNIGSGSDYRITNYEFEELLLTAIGLPAPNKVFDANWFTLRNFHGQFYADSDVLESYLHFRANKPIAQYFSEVAGRLPGYYKLGKAAPGAAIKLMGMKRLTTQAIWGTMNWIASGNRDRITAYFGNKEAWERIGSWEDFKIWRPSGFERETSYGHHYKLDHGYPEEKELQALTTEELQAAAAFRGGALLSEKYDGDPYKPLRWKSAQGHEFEMTPNLVLKGGHWCPQELPWNPEVPDKFLWDYAAEAERNPFFAQVWYPLHTPEENEVYTERIFRGFKGFEG
ncbi:MAG: NAD(P)-dependent oxidoreductase [Oscillospiraceae bacterium]|jgi:nucleoside-diphosphate-sugar epimerase|nr:NAD(P)-dependent oxidoreductase [Oscillospiraceae bacterium]